LNEQLRTSAINDFVLKSHDSKNGLLTKEEFVSWVLFGFWNRQVEPTKVLEWDERSLLNLRWNQWKVDIYHDQVLAFQKAQAEAALKEWK